MQFVKTQNEDVSFWVSLAFLTEAQNLNMKLGIDSQSTQLQHTLGWHQVTSLSWLNGWLMLQGKGSVHFSSTSTASQTLPTSLCSPCGSTGSHPTEWADSPYWPSVERKQIQQKRRGESCQCQAYSSILSSKRKGEAIGTERTAREVQDFFPFVTRSS